MAPSVLSKYFSHEEAKRLKFMYCRGEVVAVILHMKQKADDLPGMNINIAVLGDVSSGKSTFINAMRGLRSDDPGAAPTGTDELSTVPTKYRYPSLPNVHLWDLPGTNSFGFEMNSYLKQVQFESYDFYIIVSQSRFRECDGELSKKIQEQQKEFYYIRSKIDNDTYSMQMQGIDFSEGQRKIHEDSIDNFRSLSVKPPPIFLISSLEVKEYDFPKLKSTLANDIQSIRLNIFSVMVEKMIMEIQGPKYKLLIWCILLLALLSAALGSVRAPGLPFATVIGCTSAGWIFLWIQEGVSDQVLRSLSSRLAKPVSFLKTEMAHQSPRRWPSVLVKTLLGTLVVGCTIAGFTGSFHPLARSVCGAVFSFPFTYLVLKDSLDDRLRTVQNLAKTVLRPNCSSCL
ncbi:T-cell-specific guanine nucleotide triphosphate-binding protein 2-like [Pristis pectinata]|uniref:T-cell-specific guanine nucleotide triphosphate-binding protein 2-like n=1 Tax=Pristis pectinata TaxID=685728 RepID=UPI00223D6471|nr:T-cell-specific guanine nucleotide triphosphate-binding protein 2-like [Pristis pectinata]